MVAEIFENLTCLKWDYSSPFFALRGNSERAIDLQLLPSKKVWWFHLWHAHTSPTKAIKKKTSTSSFYLYRVIFL